MKIVLIVLVAVAPLVAGSLSYRDSDALYKAQHRSAASLLSKKLNDIRDGSPECPAFPDPVPYSAKFASLLQPTLAALETSLAAYFNTTGAPGVALGIVYDQQLIWSQGFGVRDPAQGISSGVPNATTLFRIGSISKVFVDLLLFLLRDQGVVQLDDPVTKYFPSFQPINMFKNEAPITLRELGCHMAGLPRESPCGTFTGNCDFSNAEMLQRLQSTYYILPPDLQPVYSNLGFALLGHTLETAAGSPFETLVSSNILQPLGMANTGFNYTADVLARLAYGTNPSLTDLGWEGPAGQMYSTVTDMAKIVSLINSANMRTGFDAPTSLSSGASASAPLLQQTTVREMILPRFINTDGLFGFGMPWEMYLQNGTWLLTKGGLVDSYSTEIAMMPSVKLGLIAFVTLPYHSSLPFIEQMIDGFLEPFLTVLQQLNPLPFVPSDAMSYVGQYQLQGYPGQANATISVVQLENGGTKLHLDNPAVFGEYDLDYDAAVDMFRLALPDPFTCNDEDYGLSGQFVVFNKLPNGTRTLAVPGLTPTFLWVQQS